MMTTMDDDLIVLHKYRKADPYRFAVAIDAVY